MGQPHADVAGGHVGQVRARVNPAVAVHLALARHQHAVAGGVGDALQHAGACRLAVLVVTDGRLDAALGVDGLARHMAEHGIERDARHLAAGLQVEIGVVGYDVSKTRVPTGLVEAAHLLAVHLGDDLGRRVAEYVVRLQCLSHDRHALGDQLLAEARRDLRAALRGHPCEEGVTVQMLAMAVVTAERAVDGRVAALDLAVGVCCIVGANDAAPALLVDVGQHQPLVRQPAQDAVAAGVADLDGCYPLPVGRAGYNLKVCANVF